MKLADIIYKLTGVSVNTASLFDIQVKRIHGKLVKISELGIAFLFTWIVPFQNTRGSFSTVCT